MSAMRGIPNTVPVTSSWNRVSRRATVCPRLTKTASPQRIQLMPRVPMKEGMRSFVLQIPLTNPATPPRPSVMGRIQRPTSFALNLLRRSSPTNTTHNATTPSTDRSIPPRTTTWWTPTAMIVGIAARLRMTWRFAGLRNLPRVPMAKMAITIIRERI